MKKLKDFAKQLKKGVFLEVFNLIKEKPKWYFLILLMDVVFLSAAFLLGKLGNVAVRPLLYAENIAGMIAAMPFYLLVLLLLYSFTKYTSLHFVKNIFAKVKLSFKRIWFFYLLNMLISAIIFAAFIVLGSLIKFGVKDQYIEWSTKIVVAVFLFFVYALISLAHSLFVLGASFKDTIKGSFRLAFKKINAYYGVYVVSVLVILAFTSVFYGLGLLLDIFFALDARRYNFMFAILSIIIVYLLQAYNRIYFYIIAKRTK